MSQPPNSPPVAPWRARLGHRRWIFLGGLVLFFIAASVLGPHFFTRAPGSDPLTTTKQFFSHAWQPSFQDQNPTLPADATPFLTRLGYELLRTLRYAIIAMSLAIPIGAILGFCASKAWWPDGKTRSRWLLHLLHIKARALIALMRSIHEIIWVIFFASALGDEPITACIALTIPFAGTLAKVFSELIDEESSDAHQTYIATGASPLRAFFVSKLPQALPDLITYTLYRFECAIRSAAVLGFIGIETIGLAIRRSFENIYWGEVWTELYILIATVLLVEFWGSLVRKRLHLAPPRLSTPTLMTAASLYRSRPRWRFLQFSAIGTAIAIAASWLIGQDLFHDRLQGKRMDRLDRFFNELVPAPVRESGDWSQLGSWASELWNETGATALSNTVAIATAAIVIAFTIALLFVPWASRSIATASPFGLSSGATPRAAKKLWTLLGQSIRGLFVLSRAVPEYILAFLLLGILGPGAWPLVIALAIHNFGILGRLWGEVLENQPVATPRQSLQSGASRLAGATTTLLPLSLNRFLLYFFYRWETCIREATILGMLGIASLGLEITLARNFFHYDQMFFYVLLGAATIITLDVISSILRSRLRES